MKLFNTAGERCSAAVIFNNKNIIIEGGIIREDDKVLLHSRTEIKAYAANERYFCAVTSSGLLYFYDGTKFYKVDYNKNNQKKYTMTDIISANNNFVILAETKNKTGLILFTENGTVFSERKFILIRNVFDGWETAVKKAPLSLGYAENTLFAGFENGFIMLMSDCSECNVLKKVSDFDIRFIDVKDDCIFLSDGKHNLNINLKLIINETISPYLCIELIKQGNKVFDFRNPEKYHFSHIKGAVNINYEDLHSELEYCKKDQIFLFYCENGLLSSAAVDRCKNYGFEKCFNIGSFSGFKDFIINCGMHYSDYICGGGE